MPFLLFTYLLTEMLAPFFASLAILNIVIFMGKLVPFLETIIELRIGLADFIRICAYITPNMLLFSIPMAVMMAVIICFARLSGDNEILALKAGGIGLAPILKPVFFFSICMALLTGYSSTKLIPAGTVAMKKLLFQLAKEKIDRGLMPKQFSEGIGDVVLHIDRIDRDSGLWHGVYVVDLRDTEHPVTIFAKSGKIRADVENMRLEMILQNGTLHRSINDIAQTIQFGRYSLDLPLAPPKVVAGGSATNVGKNGMTQKQLITEATRLGLDSPRGRKYLIEFHERLALPAGCLLLGMLGLPLAIRSLPGRRSFGLPLGLATFLLYYVLLTAGRSLADGGVIPVVPALWAPNLFFSILLFIMLRGASRDQSGHFFYRIYDGIISMGNLIISRLRTSKP